MKIIIDAGHGGSDFGAVSKDGTKMEKNYTLKYATYLGRFLTQRGYTTVETRTTDIDTPFHDRTSIASPEDLFISIHFDEDSFYGGGSMIYYADFYKAAAQRLAASKKFAENEQFYLHTQRVVGSTTSRFNRLYIDDNKCPAILIEVTSIDKADASNSAMEAFSQNVLQGIRKYEGKALPFSRVFLVNHDNSSCEVEIERMSIVGDKLYIAPKTDMCKK